MPEKDNKGEAAPVDHVAPDRDSIEDPNTFTSEYSLLQCARNGYVDTAKRRLSKKDKDVLNEIYTEDEEGLTPLHYAARYNHLGIVELLVQNKAVVDSEDHDRLTPLHYACWLKQKRKWKRKKKRSFLTGRPRDPHARTIQFLITNGAKISHKDEYGLTALHHAALRGDEIACQELLLHATKAEPLINARDCQNMIPLHTACIQGESDIARQLIMAGSDLLCVDNKLSTPLHEAATIGNTKIAQVVFDSCKNGEKLNAVLSAKDEDGNTPLMLAVKSGRYKFALQCINRRATINVTNKLHMTPLHLAAIKGSVSIVQLLIEKGASINALNHEQQTPLHKASLFNNTDCITCLLDNGARLEAKDKDNFTALLLAACYGHVQAVQLLIKQGADLSVEDKNDRTAIYLAAEENKFEVLEVLLSQSAGLEKSLINHRDEYSNTPLHAAARLGHLRIVKCLIKHGADLFCKNDMEQTPIHMASLNGRTNVVCKIVRKEKNAMSDGDEDSNTALHLAASRGHIKLVKALLDLGAEPEVRNSALRTPLGCAAMQGHIKAVKKLAKSDAVIDTKDKLDMTPLLLASANGHANVVKYLIEKKHADVTMRNQNGHNCLELAIMKDHHDVAMEIVKSESWKHALRNATPEIGVFDTPLRKLIRRMPEVAKVVYDKCIEVCKPEEGSESKPIEVKFDFEFIDDLYSIHEWQKSRFTKRSEKTTKLKENTELVPYTRESSVFIKNHPMMLMIDTSREELLDHPLVTALLRHKWISFGRVVYYIDFVSYLIFLAFLTGYVLVTTPPFGIDKSNFANVDGKTDCEKYENDGGKQHVFASIAKYFILVLDVIYILKELVQAFLGVRGYLRIENLLQCSLFVTSFVFVLDVEPCQVKTGYRMDWQWNLGSICIVLAWIMLVFFIQQFSRLGIYVVMFRDILYTFFKFFLVFLLFIIAFGLGFFCLLQNQTPYSTAWNALIRTSVMMIGELDYNNIFHGEDDMHYWLTYVLFCAFLVIMTIIIMNLLVGLAVDDIKGVQDQAALSRIAMKVQLVLDIERIILKITSRYYEKSISRPFDASDKMLAAIKRSKASEDQVQKSQKKMLKKMDKVKTTVKSLKEDFTRLQDMLETNKKA